MKISTGKSCYSRHWRLKSETMKENFQKELQQKFKHMEKYVLLK